MSAIADVTDDELALARLASRKLLGLVDGFLTVSLASLFLGDPLSFIQGRNKLIASFVDVVRTTGAKPASGFARELEVLAAQLSETTTRLYDLLLRLAGWRSLSAVEIEGGFESLNTIYLGICETSDRLFELLGTSSDFKDRRAASRQTIEETKQQLCALRDEKPVTLRHHDDSLVRQPASGQHQMG